MPSVQSNVPDEYAAVPCSKSLPLVVSKSRAITCAFGATTWGIAIIGATWAPAVGATIIGCCCTSPGCGVIIGCCCIIVGCGVIIGWAIVGCAGRETGNMPPGAMPAGICTIMQPRPGICTCICIPGAMPAGICTITCWTGWTTDATIGTTPLTGSGCTDIVCRCLRLD